LFVSWNTICVAKGREKRDTKEGKKEPKLGSKYEGNRREMIGI
jgi:hypothetical protein